MTRLAQAPRVPVEGAVHHEPQPVFDVALGVAGAVVGTGVAMGRALMAVPLLHQDLIWRPPFVAERWQPATLLDDAARHGAARRAEMVRVAQVLLDQWAPRRGRHNAVTLHLDPLDRAASDELLEHLLGAAPAPAVAEALYDRAGGNPFFLEELVSLLDGEAATEPGRVAALPDTLRGLVAARLDDLAPGVRAVLQDASVIGQTGPMVGLREMGRKLHRDVDVDAAVAAGSL